MYKSCSSESISNYLCANNSYVLDIYCVSHKIKLCTFYNRQFFQGEKERDIFNNVLLAYLKKICILRPPYCNDYVSSQICKCTHQNAY